MKFLIRRGFEMGSFNIIGYIVIALIRVIRKKYVIRFVVFYLVVLFLGNINWSFKWGKKLNRILSS